MEHKFRRNKSKKNANIVVLFVAVLFATCLVAYFAGAIYYSFHFFPNTLIDGVNCSNKSVKTATKLLDAKADGYTLQLAGRNEISDTITGAEIELQGHFETTIRELQKEQKSFLWLKQQSGKRVYEATSAVECNQDLLKERIKKLVFFDRANTVAPQDAYADRYDTKAGQYIIVKEVEGTTLDENKTIAVVVEAVMRLSSIVDLEQEGCYLEPVIKANDPIFKQKADPKTIMMGAVITYQFGDVTETVDAKKIGEWVVEDESGVSLNRVAVREYVGTLAKEHDTYGRTRTITTKAGETKSLPSGGYGWWMDKATETDELIADIMAGAVKERIPVYFCVAAQYGSDDIGKTYIEVDLTSQRLYFFQEGVNIFESELVSGNVSKGNGTPAGVFGLTYKERDATLVGENYESSVAYWMPFNGNIGFHDASWRSVFGGTEYLFNGSHGCINMPKEKAAELYELVYKSMPVVVYY